MNNGITETTYLDRVIIKQNKETQQYSAWIPVTRGYDTHFHTPIYTHEDITYASIAVGSGKISEVDTFEEALNIYITYRKRNPI